MIYITRHGETEWNSKKIFQGWKNSDLTSQGIADAKSLSKRLESVEFSKIYSSDLQRAMDTAEIIKGDRNIAITPLPDLREYNMGIWEGKPILWVQENYPDELEKFVNFPDMSTHIEEGESYKDIYDRINKALKPILEESRNSNILIVTHGGSLKIINLILRALDIKDVIKLKIVHGASLTLVDWNGESANYILDGDESHLPKRS